MRIYQRTDMPDAFIVVSGENVYDCYVGPDVSIPRCSCAAAIYRDSHCRHQKVVERLRRME